MPVFETHELILGSDDSSAFNGSAITLESNIPSNYSIKSLMFGIYYEHEKNMYYENLAG